MYPEAVVITLRRACECLESLGVPYALMGGIAVSHWKRIRATQDVDLLISIEGIETQALVDHFLAEGFRTKRQPPVLKLGDTRLLQLLYEPPDASIDIQVDLLFADNEFERTALARRHAAQIPGVAEATDVVSCEDLILLKLIAGRVIDRADAAALARNNRDTLDLPYLVRWITHFQLQPEWVEIWDEAFPGESPPA